MPRSQTAASAPNVPNGSASSTESGSDQRLVLRGEDQEHHDHRRAPARSAEAPPERFSWYDVPPQSKLKSGGSTSAAICSTARDRLARAEARRRLADDLHRRQVVEAVERVRARTMYLTVASDDSGIISPFAERT